MLQPRQLLTESQLKEALDHCAQEPIHIPGSIQPHGFLIALSDGNVIERVSANIHKLLGEPAERCIGQTIDHYLKPHEIEQVKRIVTDSPLQPIQSARLMVNGERYDVMSHRSGESFIIEFEPSDDTQTPSGNFYDELRNFAIGMHKAKSREEIFDHVTQSVRAITGFDRVKLYRFDEEWNGEVIAEDRADYMPSYKGLHFPSSDIPEQARRLYMQHYLRLIADTSYKPVPVIPAGEQPLDMSRSMLRSVSPVHIQYLENINVKASMSISIIQNNKLWGLIACHHNQPLHVPFMARHVCEIMGHIFSAQLSTMENYARREAQEKRERLVKKFSHALDKNTRIDRLMEQTHGLACEALAASGLVVKTYVHVLRFGDTPPQETVAALIDWLNAQQEGGLFETDDAQSYFKGVPQLAGLTGGILALPISMKSHDYIIWFRHPRVKEVSWAGDPEKPAEETLAGYRLTPRSSFELWKQTVSNKAEAWVSEDIQTARSLVSILLETEKMSAEQANLAKTEFLANISHEIRTPMNAVIGLAKILGESKPLTERQKEFIKTLQISADGLLVLINDLLDISKIESRTLELEEIPFSLSKLLQEVISMMSVKAQEKGVGFKLEESCIKNRSFMGDPSRIRQIILNLCSNAVKFTEQGSIDIHVDSSPTAEPGLEKVCIKVRDTGIGIAPDKIETIFHKFVQADNTITRKYGGTGLGLAITKMLTEAMGGEITVKSELGQGTEFTICVFLRVTASDAAPEEAVPLPLQQTPVKKPMVLLVEDYEPNILVATTYLEHLGYDYDIGNSGLDAVEMVKSGKYIAVLMDVQMPGLNGFDATQMIREQERASGRKRIPIIGMTAHALKGDRERCLSVGMDDYIAKPVSEDELRGKLELHGSDAAKLSDMKNG